MKIIKIVECSKKLKGNWTLESHYSTQAEQEEINKDCGIAPCKICGSYLHGFEIHEWI